jgi:alkylation response protein AidB-like acyl-CoA dehydrogenase
VGLTVDPAREEFRAEVRDWLRANVPAEPLPSLDTADGFAAHRDWERRLFDARLAVVTWPQKYGGRDADMLDWLVFEEEYWAAGAPVRVGQNGIFLLAPTMWEFATEAQLDRFMLRMARAEDIWAQGWSEPGAGSDLAALRSRADRNEDRGGWVVNGQKTWSTRAAYADWMFGLFRTDPRSSDPGSSRHHGLTYLLLPLDAEGVTIRPIRQLDGEPGFAEVFFDDVFVPDDQVLGEVGQGWKVAMSTTTSERGLTLRSPGRFMASADRLVELLRRTAGAAPALVDDVVEAWMDADAYRLYVQSTALEALAAAATGAPFSIGAESSANKLFWSQLDLRIHETALRLLGGRATLTDGPDAAWLDGYLFSLAGPIYAGTNEVQRNVVAERVLGLPR